MESEFDKRPHEQQIMRNVCVPVAAAVVVALVLVIFTPPFACHPREDVEGSVISITRVLVWAILAAVMTAVLTHSDVFNTKSGV